MRTVKRLWKRFSRTQVWRAWKRYGDRRGNRLAAATAFYGFLSMFPLIVLAAAVTAALLNDDAVGTLKTALRENLPGVSDRIDVDGLIAHAGTIGWISAITLLYTGLGWVDALRASIRSMHELDDEPGNFFQLKLTDLLALVGLGITGMIATGTTSVLSALSNRIVDWVDIEGSWIADWGLQGVSLVLGVLSGALLFLYIESGMPRVLLPRKVTLIAALVGGLVFVGAQKVGKLYVDYVIGTNEAYGALALPLALLVWIYLMTRIIMLIAAWSREATLDHQAAEAPETTPDETAAVGAGEAAYDDRGKVRVRQADTVSVAAGAVLGATATMGAVAVGRAFRTVLSALRR
jgi:membrane protein